MTTAELESRTTELASKVSAMESEIANLKERLERTEIEAAVRLSEAQFERGEGIPLEAAMESMRQKHNIPTQRQA